MAAMTDYPYISSADNSRFKTLRKLALNSRERRKQGKTLLDGVHLLDALADAGEEVELIILRQGAEEEREIQACLTRFGDSEGIILSPALFDTLSPVKTPTGVLALYRPPRPRPPQNEKCALLLENIQDPGNIGAILRTAAAARVDTVYLSRGCAEAWSPKVMRAAMGAHFVTTIFEQQNLEEIAPRFPMLIATTLDGEQPLYELDLSGNVALLLGNEGAGLSPRLTALASHRVTIPMPGKIESLNVAAAAAVCLFERVRQMNGGR